MARPSDLAPQALVFVGGDHKNSVLRVDQVCFLPNGYMKVRLFGTKNDTNRKGFEVTLPPASNKIVDPASCLKVYIERTALQRLCTDEQPLFLTLTKPYKAITSSTVADQLCQAIKLSGLGGRGYSAKSFRPTAATIAVDSGCNPDIARQVGRWQSPTVFFEHYVHSVPPKGFLDNLFMSD